MRRLIERTDLSQQVREILQGFLPLCASRLERRIAESVSEFEKQLVRLADKATNEQQNGYFDSVHEVKRGRADVMPRFLRSIEDSLAHLGQEAAQANPTAAKPAPSFCLALTDDAQLDESLVLADIATKVELRVREPLYALGKRFGVLAGTPPISNESMPLGPRSIVEALRFAAAGLDLVLAHRLVLYRCFERVVMIGIGTFYNTLNDYLIEQGILRDLHSLPTKVQPADPANVTAPRWSGESGAIEDRAILGVHAASASAMTRAGPVLVRQTPQDGRVSDVFGTLRKLLGECRRAETYTASGEDIQSVLTALQARHAAMTPSDNERVLPSGEKIKEEILAVLRELSADGRAPRIDEEDGDTIDLIAMLFEFLSRRARSDGITRWILGRLQMPILRVAIKDKSFFSNRENPARQVLSNIVEFSRFWVDETEAQNDPDLVGELQVVANRIASDYKGDIAVFSRALQDISEHSKAIAHKVELAERRHVEAARGGEKLESCRQLASAAIGELIARNKPDEFLRMLLERAWTDVLAVSLLRDGESGSGYRRRLDIAEQLLTSASSGENSPARLICANQGAEIEAGLKEVGLHDDDVHAIVRKLFATSADGGEDPISQTELAIKLRGKPKLGVGRKTESTQTLDERSHAPLTRDELAALDRICTLAPGTWLEFVINEHGDTARRKLSWYSTLTGRCLFINQRGVPTKERTLEGLAREMASGRARVASTEQEPLLDRAWSAITETLNYFSTHKLDNYFGIPTLADRALDIHRQRIAAHEESPQTRETRTLLLVDDEENILRALKRVLRTDGYQILTAMSARDALEVLRRHDVQVVVSDQRMPEVSGIEFLNDVKKMYPDTVRIMLSGYSDAAAVTDAINRGTIYKFLTKPWNDEDIRDQVRSAFGGSAR